VILAMVSYLIYLGPITVSDKPWLARLISYSLSNREDGFRDGVRARDRKCVITGNPNNLAQYGRWDMFQATHIFPMHLENLWIQFDYGRWITNMDGVTGATKMNSVQNGLLLLSHVHSLFDQYMIGINPDVSILEPELDQLF
jgi:HNH endonuclease